MKNQNLVNLLSKVSLITSSIEDHVNRRFNRILLNNNSLFVSCSISPKNSNSSSAESGLTGSDVHINDVDSNDDLSDDGLDYSQKFSDNQVNNEPNDDTFIGKRSLYLDPLPMRVRFKIIFRLYKILEANVKLQSTIDKVLNKLEEFSNQFPESQMQLIVKLDDSQKALSDLKAKLQSSETSYKDDINELQMKIDNLEGL